MEIVNFVKENVLEEGQKLLYLTKFGSHLYGTDSPESDVDYKGIFLPNKKDMLLGRKVKSLNYKTGNGNTKNTKEDTDIDLWSIQYFFELLGKGETNAVDLVYSFTNPDCVEMYNTGMLPVFEQPLNFFNPINCNAYVGYAIGQAKKYGLKGSRLGVLKQVYEYLERVVVCAPDLLNEKLSVIVEDILDNFYDDSYCFMKHVNDEEALVLCGKVHLFSITLEEFYQRISREFNKYGERVKDAEKNRNIDWKSLSHAVRCLDQMNELLTTGGIEYPLDTKFELKDIKNGGCTFQFIEELIQIKLERVKTLQERTGIKGKKDSKLIEDIILNLYNEE